MSVEHADLRPVGVADAIRNNLLIVALCAIVGFALGFLGGSRGEDTRSATTPILLNPLEGNPYYPTRTGENLTNLLTEAQSVRSNAVAALVAERLGVTSDPEALLRGVAVSSPVNTQILDITVTHIDPDVALERSQAFAEVYLEYRRSRAVARISEQTDDLDAQIAQKQARLDELTAQLDEADEGSAEAQLLENTLTSESDQISALGTRRAELASTPTDPGQVVTPAALQATSILNGKVLMPIAGAMLGLAGGIIVAMLRSRSDLAVRDAQEVRDLGVPVIGTIGGDLDVGPYAVEQVLDDEYRKLRVAVLAIEKRRPFSLVVASTRASSTEPLTAIDLATSFARAGLDTTLIDATESGSGPASVLAPDDSIGLTEVLIGNAVLTNALAPVAPMMWVLPPGRDVAGMSDLFVSEEMAELLARAQQHGDVVIVATGSIQGADAQSLASMCDAVVLEVEEDRTTRPEIERARQTLDVLPCVLLGAVYVGADVSPRAAGFRPETTTHRRQLRRGRTRAELPAGPAHEQTARPRAASADPDDDRWTATATYDPERRAWVVDAVEYTEEAEVARPARKAPAKKTAAKKATGARKRTKKAPAARPRNRADEASTATAAPAQPAAEPPPEEPRLDLGLEGAAAAGDDTPPVGDPRPDLSVDELPGRERADDVAGASSEDADDGDEAWVRDVDEAQPFHPGRG